MNNINYIHPKVAALDFARLKFKYAQSEDAEFTEQEWDLAELEYRRFLTLKVENPKQALVPSKQVDKIWHAHILDTRAYQKDCQTVFGYFIHHYPYFGINGDDDKQLLNEAFDKTNELYQKTFNSLPPQKALYAARCEGHACHAPSSCACRVPGACK